MLITASDFQDIQDLSDASLIPWHAFEHTQGYWWCDDDGIVWIKSYGSVIACFDKAGNIIPHEYFEQSTRAHVQVLHREFYKHQTNEVPMRSFIEKCLDLAVGIVIFMICTLLLATITIWILRAVYT